MSDQEKTIKDAEGLREALKSSLGNLAIPRNTAIVHKSLKEFIERTARLTNKPASELVGTNVIVSQLFPFKCEDGRTINGAMYDAEGNITWLIQGNT